MKEILKNLETLIGCCKEDVEALKEVSATTSKWEPEVIKIFYDTLFAYEPTKKVFKEGERPDREKTLADWYLSVVKGEMDDAFWNKQWMVGLIHVWRGVPNHFMLAIMSKVQIAFLHNCLKEFEPAQAEKVFKSFKHLTDVIVGLIAESYFQKYLESVREFSGIKQSVIDRMVTMEVEKLIKEYRAK
jgi:hypothetical protein